MKIREANIDDSNDIFEWRNDPITRQMSFNSDVVTFSTHNKWFENSLYNKNRYLFIAEEEGRKISVIRFDIKEEKSTAEISINFNPMERGKRFSSKVILKSISYFNIIDNKRIKTIIAKIKKKNIASKRSFMKCGFKLGLIKGNTEIYNFIFYK